MSLPPIVAIAGDESVHRDAEQYNRRLNLLHRLEEDLSRANSWNTRERFSRGFFSDRTNPPVETSSLVERIGKLLVELADERASIVKRGQGARP